MSIPEQIIVAIVDDDTEIRNLLEILIDRSGGFSCKHVYACAEDAIPHIQNAYFDVVLMDVEMPGMNGIECVRQLKPNLPNTDFIMLTIRDDFDTVFQSLAAGATGYLLKDTAPTKLLEGIKEVHNGGSPMTPEIARKVTQTFKLAPSPISDRETEILKLMCDGQHYNEIASTLFISGHTVRTHIKNIYKKLHVSSRAEAVRTAIETRII